VVLLFDPQAFDTFTLPKSAASHASSYVLAALLTWLFLKYGPGLFVWSPIHLAMGAVVLSFILATPFALDPFVAMFGAWRRYLGLTQMLDNGITYIAASVLFPTLSDVKRLFAVAAAALVPVVAYAVAQQHGLDPVSYVQSTLRPPSTLGQPDMLGGYLSIAVCTMFGAAVVLWRPLSWPGRILLVAAAAACFAALLPTGVRSGVLGLLGGLLALVAVLLVRPDVAKRVSLAIVLLCAVLASVAIIASPVWPRLINLASDPAVLARVEMWEAAEKAIWDRPLLGVGPDNYAVVYPSLRAERSVFISVGELQTSTHNWFLYAATSAGLAGGLAVVVLIAFVVAGGLRLARRGPLGLCLIPIVALLSQGLTVPTDVGTDWILWVCAGLVAAWTGRRLSDERWRRLSYDRRWLPAAAGVVLLAASAWGINSARGRVLASEAMLRSESLVAANRGSDAATQIRDALLFDPRRPEHWSAFGVALSAAGNLSAAASAFEEAASRAPWHPLYWRNLAIMRLAQGDGPAAFVAAEKATRADPYDAVSRDLLARLAFDRGDYPRAVDEGERAVHLAPSNIAAYDAPVRASIQLRQWDRADRMLNVGLAATQSLHLRVLRAELLLAQDRRIEARLELDAVLAQDPRNAEAIALRNRLDAPP
jgi:O-antigen ligase/Flp pilus assembly protein TadD